MTILDILAKIGLAAIGLFVCFIVLIQVVKIVRFAKSEFSEAKRKDGLRSVLESIFVSALFLAAVAYGIYSYLTSSDKIRWF